MIGRRGRHRAGRYSVTVADIQANLNEGWVPTGRTFCGMPTLMHNGREYIQWPGRITAMPVVTA